MIQLTAWTDSQRQELLKDGYCKVEQWVSPAMREQIQSELAPWLTQITWNDSLGYALMSGDKWLHHLGLCSKTLLHSVLHEPVLDFMAKIFGQEPVLAEFSLHHSTHNNRELPYHSDRDGGVILYLFLTDMTAENGQLSVIPGTQNRNEYFFIPQSEIEAKKTSIVPLFAKAGDAVIFDQDVWHKRGEGKPGRTVVKALYQPQSRLNCAVDHVLRQSMLEGLNSRQLRTLGIGLPAFQRRGHFRKVGRPFWHTDLKIALYYLLRFRQFGKGAKEGAGEKYVGDKMRERPERIRAAA